MLTYERKADDGGAAVYEFRPNGTEQPGTAMIDLSSGEASLVEPSPDENGMCWGQMLAHLRRMFKAGDLRQSGTLSWY